jgi:aminobenzoyl-glutamate transport protein
MKKSDSLLQKFLHQVERAGNALPHPAVLFLYLTAAVFILSSIASRLGFSAIHPVKKDLLQAVDLLSVGGLHILMTDLVKNFAGFAPLGTVLVAMLGFSIAEKSGLLGALLRLVVINAPKALLVPAVLLASVVSHTAGDVGYVLLIPLAAMAFHAAGLHPLAGLAVCFAGVSGGFSANFLLSTLDPLLAGLTQEAARIIHPGYAVSPVVNWYFMATSSVLIIGVGTLVANRVTMPFLGPYKGHAEPVVLERLTANEKRGLNWALAVLGVLTALVLAGTVPDNGFLRDPKTGSLLDSPFLKGIVALIFVYGASAGLAYGYGSRHFKSQKDVVDAMQDGMVTMAPYLVMVFFAAQFIALFNASNVGLILAVHGSEALKSMGLGTMPLMIGFIVLTCVLDLLIGSASAKWALMAPVFVPMFMLLGVSPELTQASYRIGDSVINIVSPLMAYFPLILAFAGKYEKDAKVGTILALMIPYSTFFLIAWCLLLFVWVYLGLPLGPGAAMHYALPPVP